MSGDDISAARSASLQRLRAPVVGIGLGIEVVNPEEIAELQNGARQDGGTRSLIDHLRTPRMIGFVLECSG